MKSLRTTFRDTGFAVSLTFLLLVPPGWAHDPAWVFGGFGTAIVDGTLSPGEWAGASSVTFEANLPAHDGGGTVPATMLVMNDGTNLYVAFRIARGGFGQSTNPYFLFDADHDTATEPDDDGFGMSVNQISGPELRDTFAVDASGNHALDIDYGGTNDGTTAASTDGTSTFLEMSKPLNSGDAGHDFSLSPGDVIGFGGQLNLFSLDPTCVPATLGSDCQAFTDLGGTFTSSPFVLAGDIMILSPSRRECTRIAVRARDDFVASCLAEGGRRASCNRQGARITRTVSATCLGR